MKRFFVLMIFAVVLNMMNNLKASNPRFYLTPQQEKIVTISAFASIGKLDKLKPELTEGLEAGLTINEIKEILVHLYAYSGFPRSLRGIQTFMEVLDEREAKGINDNWGRESTPITDTLDNKYERGKKILAKLSCTTPPEGRVTKGYAGFSPEIETFLKEHLFADLFERDVLTYAQRETVTLSVLMSIGDVEPMLNAHINLALNLGITSEQVKEIIQIIKINVGKKESGVAEKILDEVLKNRNLK